MGKCLKKSPGIIRKSRVSYPVPGFLSSATWHSLPKKHYNGLNQTKPNQSNSQNGYCINHVWWIYYWSSLCYQDSDRSLAIKQWTYDPIQSLFHNFYKGYDNIDIYLFYLKRYHSATTFIKRLAKYKSHDDGISMSGVYCHAAHTDWLGSNNLQLVYVLLLLQSDSY